MPSFRVITTTLIAILPLLKVAQSLGLHTQIVGGTDAVPGQPPVCQPGQLYELEIPTVVSIIPSISEPASITCGSRTLSTARPDSCEWAPKEFLHMLFNRAIELMRQGVPKEDAFQCFLHARGVLYNFQICDSLVNNNTRATIPVALELLYGTIFALMQAKYPQALNTSKTAIPLANVLAVYNLAVVGSELNVDLKFPDQLLAPSGLVSTMPLMDTTLRSLKEKINTTAPEDLPAVSRPGAWDPNYNCDYNGAPANTWNLRQYPGTPTHSDEHCCAQACTGTCVNIGD